LQLAPLPSLLLPCSVPLAAACGTQGGERKHQQAARAQGTVERDEGTVE